MSQPMELTQPKDSCTAALLAGGESRRMGRNKADLQIGEKLLWERQLRTLWRAEVGPVVVSGPPSGPFRGVRIIEDFWLRRGPLGGLATVFANVETEWVLVLAVDLPLIRPEFLRVLVQEAIATGAGVVPWDGQRFHPLAAVYPRAAAAELAEERVERGELAMQAFVRILEERGAVRRWKLSADELRMMRNLNTPADVEGIEGETGE